MVLPRALLLLSVLGQIAVTPLVAQEPTPTDTLKVDWRSRAGNLNQQSADFGNLYVTLYNARSLLVRQVPYEGPSLIEDVLRAEHVFYGSYFPIGLDNVICDLNPSMCRRDLLPASTEQLAEVTGHVGGFQFSTSRWSVWDGQEVTVPDYHFEPYSTLEETAVPDGWEAELFHADPNVNCTRWLRSCSDLVKVLNPPSLFAKAPRRTAVLPVAGWQTTVALATDDRSTYAELLELTELEPTAGFAKSSDAFAAEWSTSLTHKSTIDLTLESLDRNWVTIGRGSQKAYTAPDATAAADETDEPAFADQVELLRLIAHPFADKPSLAPMYQQPVGILVLDEAFDPNHCDLPPIDGQPVTARPCDVRVAAPDPMADHAVHIVGLISAPRNGRGIVGLDPWARVSFARVNTLFASQTDFLLAMDALVTAAASAKVANLSWGADRAFGGNTLGAAAAALNDRMLLVVAAGNEARRFHAKDCPVVPACLADRDNVITVVGLNRDAGQPALWQTNPRNGSNSSRTFGIGAIAQDILSTVRDDSLGVMSGTSMAAPQVTAAAALIFSAAEYVFAGAIAETGGVLAPKVVKDRLLYTADIFPGLQDELSSGRLNTTRAINIVETQLLLRTEAGLPKPVGGRLIKVPAKDISCVLSNGEETFVPWASIRRLTFVPEVQRYLIFRQADGRHSPLEKVELCNLATRSPEGILVLPDDTELVFAMKNVLDYTSPLFE